MDKSNKGIKNVLKKIKIEYLIIAFMVLCVVYFLLSDNVKKSNTNLVVQTSSENSDYSEYIASKIKSCIENINGVSKVNVTVTVNEDIKIIYATDKVTVGTGDTAKVTETTVKVNGEPVVIQKIYPKISGVVITAEGVKDLTVRENIVKAVCTCLGVDSLNIQIIESK